MTTMRNTTMPYPAWHPGAEGAAGHTMILGTTAMGMTAMYASLGLTDDELNAVHGSRAARAPAQQQGQE
ncbi:hypothetical protein BDI4_830046 [Burkholderia diffusa]|uniref:hypothetical protein n=1 Tax=Burkholderia diffusa TaxID=488732 RepID=UPI001CAE0A07|nr:hypothetical protein [Burkholderia diffusa]CAG9264359.1 hypothetical protein BDI4_830046 [Burkholderia diffusa]